MSIKRYTNNKCMHMFNYKVTSYFTRATENIRYVFGQPNLVQQHHPTNSAYCAELLNREANIKIINDPIIN